MAKAKKTEKTEEVAPITQATESNGGKPNYSQLVRDMLEKDITKPKDIQAAILSEHGVEVPDGSISNAKNAWMKKQGKSNGKAKKRMPRVSPEVIGAATVQVAVTGLASAVDVLGKETVFALLAKM